MSRGVKGGDRSVNNRGGEDFFTLDRRICSTFFKSVPKVGLENQGDKGEEVREVPEKRLNSARLSSRSSSSGKKGFAKIQPRKREDFLELEGGFNSINRR